MFVYRPELLLIRGSSLSDFFLSISIAFLSILAISSAVSGYLFRECNIFERIILLFSVALLVKPNIIINITGILIMCCIYFVNYYSSKKLCR